MPLVRSGNEKEDVIKIKSLHHCHTGLRAAVLHYAHELAPGILLFIIFPKDPNHFTIINLTERLVVISLRYTR